ncbi:MAG: capsid portal protein, partial [Comamonas sp.]
EQGDVDTLREARKSSKGLGNFRNLFFHSPGCKKDGIQLLPIGEAAAKDEFFNIKNVSRDDQLAAHRVPPELIGVVPSITAGFGNVVNAARVFARNEIQSLQDLIGQCVNDFAGEEVCK